MTAKKISIVAVTIIIACTYYLFVKKYLLATNFIGIVLQTLSIALIAWSRFTFGIRSFHAAANTTKGKLVTTGPYKWLRHPVYAGGFYFIWTGIAFHFNFFSIIAGTLLTIAIVCRIIAEEFYLKKTYANYTIYMQTTKRLIPFIF